MKIHNLTKHQGVARNDVVAAIKLFSSNQPRSHIFNCDQCSFKSDKSHRVKEHRMTKHDGVAIECSNCGKRFGRRDILKRHVQIMHSDHPKQTCNFCSFTATTETLVNRHKARIHDSTEATATNVHKNHYIYKCNDCTMTFRRKITLLRHRNTVHTSSATKYPCDECEAEFDNLKHLKLHKYSHNSSGPDDQRPLCPLACTEKAGLTHHLKFYHRESRHKCDKCNFWTHKPRLLRRHQINFHENKLNH